MDSVKYPAPVPDIVYPALFMYIRRYPINKKNCIKQVIYVVEYMKEEERFSLQILDTFE